MHVVQYFGAQTGLLSKSALTALLKKAPKNYMPKDNMKTFREVLTDADARRVAVGHFNISDLAALKGIFAAARELQLPVLIGVSEGEREFIGVKQVAALIKSLREQYDYPIFLNADHTHSLDKAKEAAEAGFDEIVFDNSQLAMEQNIENTKEAVAAIRAINPNIIIEGEIGYIGSIVRNNRGASGGIAHDVHAGRSGALCG